MSQRSRRPRVMRSARAELGACDDGGDVVAVGLAEAASVVMVKNYTKSYTHPMMVFVCRNST